MILLRLLQNTLYTVLLIVGTENMPSWLESLPQARKLHGIMNRQAGRVVRLNGHRLKQWPVRVETLILGAIQTVSQNESALSQSHRVKL